MRGLRAEGCGRVEARLPLLLDRALGALDEARDLGHLEACAHCRADRDAYEHLLARLPAAWSAGVSSEGAALVATLRRRLEDFPAPRRGPRFRPHPALAAAVAAGLLLLLRLCFGPDLAHFPLEGASDQLDPLLKSLPSWSQVWDGLGQLSRWVS